MSGTTRPPVVEFRTGRLRRFVRSHARDVTATLARVRRGALLTVAVLLVPTVLALDANASRVQQAGLGLLVGLVLLVCLLEASREERLLVASTVLVATLGELFLTQVWGAYRYRFGNVPLYVVLGHGLVAWVGLTVQRSLGGARWPVVIVAVASVGWMVGGLFSEHPDVEGAAFAPFFLPLLLSRERTAHAATWAYAAGIELCGTFFATWEWSPVLPWLELPAANPPSGAAGGYCWFAILAAGLVKLLTKPRRRVISDAFARGR